MDNFTISASNGNPLVFYHTDETFCRKLSDKLNWLYPNVDAFWAPDGDIDQEAMHVHVPTDVSRWVHKVRSTARALEDDLADQTRNTPTPA